MEDKILDFAVSVIATLFLAKMMWELFLPSPAEILDPVFAYFRKQKQEFMRISGPVGRDCENCHFTEKSKNAKFCSRCGHDLGTGAQ
jgi:uncharacterized paraquat-inducible protein A